MNDAEGASVGKRLKRLRTKRLLTQADLSRLSGVPVPTIKDIERGATQNPRYKTVRLLAEALDVKADYLLYGEELLDDFRNRG